MQGQSDDYPEWTDADWAKARQGAPWDWPAEDRAKTKERLTAILKAADRHDYDAIRGLAQEALAELG
jgi:predicted lipid-binding transport protein (Tim44 family)